MRYKLHLIAILVASFSLAACMQAADGKGSFGFEGRLPIEGDLFYRS